MSLLDRIMRKQGMRDDGTFRVRVRVEPFDSAVTVCVTHFLRDGYTWLDESDDEDAARIFEGITDNVGQLILKRIRGATTEIINHTAPADAGEGNNKPTDR
jgi:hypothetical protein